MSSLKKNKSFISDITLNIFGSGITAVILQFVIYPLLNRNSSPQIFGEILLMMAIVNIVAVLLGNSLNNIRLINNKDYVNEEIKGDFPFILLFASITNIIIIFVIAFILWDNQSFLERMLLVSISILSMLRAYLTVDYRLNLDYKKNLVHNVFYSIALLISTLVILITDIWQFVFFIAELFSLFYLLKTTTIIKEPFKITLRFKKTIKQFIYLSISNLIGNLLLYIDRIIIFPFLGAYQVSVFFAATVIGKMFSFVLSPISGVMLSYISNKKNMISKRDFLLINIAIIIFSLVATLLTLLVSKYLLKLLYPDLYQAINDILLVSNLAAILFASSTITQAILLKYKETSFQIVIQIIYGLIFVLSGIILIQIYGLEGFSYAALLASIIKFALILVLGISSLNEK